MINTFELVEQLLNFIGLQYLKIRKMASDPRKIYIALANPHRIRYIQKVDLIGALYEPR